MRNTQKKWHKIGNLEKQWKHNEEYTDLCKGNYNEAFSKTTGQQ